MSSDQQYITADPHIIGTTSYDFLKPHFSSAVPEAQPAVVGTASTADHTLSLQYSAPSQHPSSTSDSPDPSPAAPIDRKRKRERNTEAARRYRQRKVDRTSELEDALAEVKKERDELRLKLARSQAEADVLRSMVGKGH
ncbi:hypothetical protein LTR36_010872 [Oleoguttula mirabilis]|uniref:BZIP domain-containing protein n=1 Tax=Oleoguttula mirabilis TaxID=1507867 RepID=A0AAV9J4E1_9PEZI|nr:hypothetical protein LTR36_010872 [Oleoguttula mirabilis]